MTGLVNTKDTALLVIDIQERLMPVIHEKDKILIEVNRLIKGTEALNLPIIVTEQYPRGLGKTCQEIELPEGVEPVEKISFSCMQSDGVLDQLKEKGIRSLILCGAETHICVLNTALEALDAGFEVHVVADAVSSRTPANKQLGLERMKQSGAFIVSVEMIMFQLLDEAGNNTFKAISKLIK